MIYYVVLVSGIPEAVTTLLSRAQAYRRELESKNRPAIIVPCAPLESLSEEGKEPDEREVECACEGG